jgi:hypothetical protein
MTYVKPTKPDTTGCYTSEQSTIENEFKTRSVLVIVIIIIIIIINIDMC